MRSSCADGAPHYWEIDTLVAHGVYGARCRKCGGKRTYWFCIESDAEKGKTIAVRKNIVIRIEASKKT